MKTRISSRDSLNVIPPGSQWLPHRGDAWTTTVGKAVEKHRHCGKPAGVYRETDMLSVWRRSSHMRQSRLSKLNFMALCCVLGLFTKKLINPLANVITETLHIPGGISTGFSIMFLVVAAEVVYGGDVYEADANGRQWKHCGTLMGAVQGFLALCLGRVGSMGILAPIGYIVPGMMIDLIYGVAERFRLDRTERMVFANALAAVMASVTANVIVFRLWGPVLFLYLCVSAFSGTLYGFLGLAVAAKLRKAVGSL